MEVMKNLLLKAQRQALGLTVLECAEMCKVNKRTFQYWEAGTSPVKENALLFMDLLVSHYNLVLSNMLKDVESSTVYNEHNDKKPSRISPTLPFYLNFELFQEKTGCNNLNYWRVYQAVVGQLLLLDKIVRLNDDVDLPADWWVWGWFNGEYEAH